MKNHKKWGISIICIAMCAIISFGTLTYICDPLLQYRPESKIFTYWNSTEIYSNPGIAKNYKYDSVLVGSSVTENTDINECNELFNCNMVKLTYSGASSYNHKKILDVCFNSGNIIKSVYWGLDEYALTTDYMTPRYPLPDYLYDYNKLNDLSYLLNLDVFYFYTLKDILGTLKHESRIAMDGGSWVSDYSIYNAEHTLAEISYPRDINKNKGEKYYQDNLKNNLKYNIIPTIKNNPNTTFNFFLTPYSIGYWYIQYCRGTLEAELYNAEIAIGEILKFDNVNVYFFQDCKDIITNLDNYKDFTHFHPDINSFMMKEMAEGNYKINNNNYKMVIEEFKKYVLNFDYDSYFSNYS